ncbi:MAG: preprotein translocase subunit SecG [Dysgonamonadaceae bacterium]|jgi:preprotein translocase subunit SecG|nr:preprotein translocase subunit SecG [Dysgonamonadaceae bacterium]
MYVFISILIVIIAIFLSLIVVIQNSKGGGLAAGFASSNQVMGVRKTTDFLEKATWWLAGILVGLCVIASFLHRHSVASSASDSRIKNEIIETIPAIPEQDPNAITPFENPVQGTDEMPVPQE